MRTVLILSIIAALFGSLREVDGAMSDDDATERVALVQEALTSEAPSLILRGPSPIVSAISAGKVVAGPKSRAVGLVPAWNEVAFLNEAWVQSWGTEGYLKRFDLTSLGDATLVDKSVHWSISNNGHACAIALNGNLFLLRSNETPAKVTLQIDDNDPLDSVHPSNSGVGSGIALDPNGSRILVAFASNTRFEQNTSQAPLHDTYIFDIRTGKGTLLHRGSLPAWIDAKRVLVLELEPDAHYGLPNLKVIDVESKEVLLSISDIHAYSLTHDGFAVFYDTGMAIRSSVYDATLKLTHELEFERPVFGGMTWMKVGLRMNVVH